MAPLSGLRLLSFALNVPGPVAVARLVAEGATAVTVEPLSGGRLGGGDPAYGIHAARDGRVAAAALEPHFRAHFYAALALPLDAPLAAATHTRTGAEWAAFARDLDLPLSIVRSGT